MEYRTDLRERMNCPHCLETAQKMKVYLTRLRGLKKKKKRLDKLSFLRLIISSSDNSEISKILEDINLIKKKDPNHWKGDEAIKVSRIFVKMYVTDNLVQIANSGP